MFSFKKPSIYQTPKCHVTYGTMSYPDANQLPTKAKPWSALLSQNYIHKIDLIFPEEVMRCVKENILDDTAYTPSYQRVIMTLGQVLERDFFTQYIKIGNIMMLSEGRADSNNVFSIKDGLLTMCIVKETYERAGLVGKPHGVKGARGLQPRWIVEYNLRSPSALHGKKGFDRLVYACKNALNEPTTWLFYNLSESTVPCSYTISGSSLTRVLAPDPDPIVEHFPTKYTSNPSLVQNMVVNIPPLGVPLATLKDQERQELDEYAAEVYEWLSLVRLESPRVKPGDKIDPYLSSYAVPGSLSENSTGRLCKITWQGFIPPSWAARTLAALIKIVPQKEWFSFSATPFTRFTVGHGAECTIMRPPDSPGEYVLWEIKGHE